MNDDVSVYVVHILRELHFCGDSVRYLSIVLSVEIGPHISWRRDSRVFVSQTDHEIVQISIGYNHITNQYNDRLTGGQTFWFWF